MRKGSVLLRSFLPLLGLLAGSAAHGAIPSSERAALLALHDSAGGANWSDRTGWGGSPGTECSWAGVRCNDAGTTVVELGLSGNNLVGTPEIGGLPNLVRLDLGGNPLGGKLPPGIGSLQSLEILSVSSAGLTGSLPKEIGSLTKLRSLWLNGNELSGEIPSEIGSLSALEELSLYSNQLSGPLPPSIGNLGKLRILYLGYNRLSGAIPKEIGRLGSVVELYLVDNRLTGPIPPEISGLASVETLNLAGNQLSGAIPDAFGGLKKLTALDLSYNRSLSGLAPASFASLTALDSLGLAETGLTDISAVDFTRMTKLRELGLGGNQLSGPIPESLGRVATLRRLDLWGNRFTGAIPASFASLASLEILAVGGNLLTDLAGDVLGALPKLDQLWAGGNPLKGPFPAGLTRSKSLRVVDLSYCDLTGPLPASLGDLATLEELRLVGGSLTGPLPGELGKLAKLRVLALPYNTIGGEIPASFQGLRALEDLGLSGNRLTGEIPAGLMTLPALSGLDLSHNRLSGAIPRSFSSLQALRSLSVRDNGLTGAVPPELGDLVTLVDLDLGENQLTGPIPRELGNLTALEGLGLDDNQLTGSVPSSLGRLTKLVGLDLSGNQLGGELPSELGDLAVLRYLFLGGNQIGGWLPGSLGKLTALRELRLEGNLFSGPIPPGVGDLAELEVLDVGANQLTGTLPRELGRLGKLVRFHAGYNRLAGQIPAALGDLAALEVLDLERNQLTGPIPEALGRLGALRQLELGGNRLSGALPPAIGSLAAIRYLGLWGNQLTGELPATLARLTTLEDGWGLGLAWNALRTEDAALRDFVVRKGGSFDRTQTVAPTLLSVAAVSTNQVTLRWAPILYQDDPGGYEVLAGFTGGAGLQVVVATTSSKRSDAATVSGLLPGRSYTFTVRSFTRPHEHNASLLVSEPGPAVTTETAVAASVVVKLEPSLVRVLPGGSAPMTVTVTPAPPSGATVGLTVSNGSFASVPATVTIPSGASSASFNVTGRSVGVAYIVARLPSALGGTAALADVVVDTSTCERPEVPAFLNAAQATVRAGNPINLAWTPTLAGDRTGVYQVEVTTNADCTTGRVRLVTPEPSMSLRTEKVAGTVCAVVRAVSGAGCASGDSQPVRVTVQPPPPAFVVSQAQLGSTVTSAGNPAAPGRVVFKNIGSQPAALTVASRIGTFTPQPSAFESVPPDGTAVVTLHYDPLTSATPAVLFDSLCGTWTDTGVARSVCTAVTLTTLATPPTATAGGTLQLVGTNEVHFVAPSGKAPPTQTVTVANSGTAPVRIVPSIGPGGAWLGVSQADFATPLQPGESRSFVLSVDRSRRSTADGSPPLTTNLVLTGVDGPADQRPRAVVQVFDEEPSEVAAGTGRAFLGPRDSSLFLATGVSAPGQGTYFLSDGWIKNKGAVPAVVTLYYTPNGGDGIGHPGVKRAVVTLTPYQTYRLADFVRGLFGTTGSGSVELRSPQIADLSVRTTVDSLIVKPRGIARFGAEIPTVRSREGASLSRSSGAPLLLPGIRGGPGSAFRTNLILAETSGSPLRVGLRLLSADGAVLRETEAVVAAYSKQQVNGTDGDLFPQDAAYEGATLEVRPLEGIGSVVAFATIVDNASQAYTTRTGRSIREAAASTPAGKAALATPAYNRLVVPAVARAQGRNSSFFTTALSMTNGTAGDAKITLRYLPDSGTAPKDVPVTVPGRKTVSYKDVLLEVFKLEPSTAGMLTLEGADVRKLVVASETSTPLSPEDVEKGISPATLAAYAPESSQAIGDPSQALPSAVVSHPGLEESARFRTNLILAETAGQPAKVRVRVFLPASGGVPLAEKDYELAAFQRLQVNKFILDVTGSEEGAVEFLDLETSVEWLSGAGRILAVATKIDNDPESKRTDIYVLGPVGSAQGTIGF